MNLETETVTLNGVEYVRKGSETAKVSDNYVIIRGDRSGVFAGNLVKKEGREVTLENCRRIWYWEGASSLSQLAMEGVKKPNNCKFPCEVSKIKILDAIEVINCTDKAIKSIASVPVWEQK